MAYEGVVVLGVMAAAAAAAVAAHLAHRPVMGRDDSFPATIVTSGPIRFRVKTMDEGLCSDCCSVDELVEEVASRRGQVLRVIDLAHDEDEYVQVMDDGSTWYPWASRHKVDLRTRFSNCAGNERVD